MKNKIGIIAVVLTAAYSGFSQGEVEFQNSSQTKISVNTQGAPATFSAISGANSYYFALFNSVTATTVAGVGSVAEIPTSANPGSYAFSDPNWTLDGYGASVSKAGTFAATTVDAALFTQIPGQPQASQFVVIGWSANIGSTIASLQSFFAGTDAGVTSGFVGESVVSGSITTGTAGSSSAPPALFATAAPYIQAFDLAYTVPEPSSIALGVMGAASLLALRRKKA
jgi:hypothetical protein